MTAERDGIMSSLRSVERERDRMRERYNASVEMGTASEADTARLREVVEAARNMPRRTPGSGGAETPHQFTIDAGHVWQLDRALKKLDQALAPPSGVVEHPPFEPNASTIARASDAALWASVEVLPESPSAPPGVSVASGNSPSEPGHKLATTRRVALITNKDVRGTAIGDILPTGWLLVKWDDGEHLYEPAGGLVDAPEPPPAPAPEPSEEAKAVAKAIAALIDAPYGTARMQAGDRLIDALDRLRGRG